MFHLQCLQTESVQCKIVADTHCHGVTVTSSPGSYYSPTAAISPEVQEFTVIACLTLKCFSINLSNS